MKTDNDQVQAAAQPVLQDFTSCPDWGKGGRFIYDPATKTRTRVDEQPAEADAQTAEASVAQGEALDTPTTVKKERTRG